MAIQTRTIKGQPTVQGNSLVQDQILLVTTDGKSVREATGLAVLIENIWDDLQSATGTWKRKKNNFYWEIDVTDTSEDRGTDAMVKQMVSCPRPTPELFDFDFTDSDGDSEWTSYWKMKFRETENSPYNGKNAVYRKEVILPGTKYIKFGNALSMGQDQAIEGEDGTFTSEEITIDQITVDLDDTMNLLGAAETTIGSKTDLGDVNALLGSLIP